MTINADTLDLTEVTRKAPSASGYYRDVWFVGDDLVVKCDRDGGSVCATEYENYTNFSDFDFEINGETHHVRFPETAMVGNYLVMQRIKHRFLIDMYSGKCPGKPAGERWCDYSTHYGEHADGILEKAVSGELYRRYSLNDMHTENFMFDDKTKTFWILDFAQ